MNYYNYFTEIEETFVRRRAKHLFLSPLDWALIEAWQERGIPLHIVIRSIESVFDVFDKQPPGTRTIKSLLYCREEIEAQHAEWLRSQTGKAAEVEPEKGMFALNDITQHIATAITQLEANTVIEIREDVLRAVGHLRELSRNVNDDYETIDKTLSDIERILDRSMLANWNPAHLKAIKKELSGALRQYKADMEDASYRSTFDLMLLKRLREEAGIPRLGLFYL